MHIFMCLFVTSFSHITELNKLIKKLDKRILASRSGGFKSKVRVLSSPSTLLPPPNPPAWSVTKECLQMSGTTATPTGVSDAVVSAVRAETSTSTPAPMPRGIVQRRLSMSDSVTINDNSVTITDNSVTSNYASEVTPCRQEYDHDVNTDSDDSDSISSSSSMSD